MGFADRGRVFSWKAEEEIDWKAFERKGDETWMGKCGERNCGYG